jgi:hypothetical protein
MKKIFTVLIAACLLIACNNNAERAAKTEDSSNKVPANYDSTANNKMDNTIEKNDNVPKSDTVKTMDKSQSMYPEQNEKEKQSLDKEDPNERRPRERRPRE